MRERGAEKRTSVDEKHYHNWWEDAEGMAVTSLNIHDAPRSVILLHVHQYLGNEGTTTSVPNEDNKGTHYHRLTPDDA